MNPNKVLLITDAWAPQTNGVVTTWNTVIDRLERNGVTVEVIHPGLFRTAALPSYPEIRIVINPWRLSTMLLGAQPDAIHIATEGPLGIYARRWLARHQVPFTTSLHTKFPEYIHQRIGLPLRFGYRFMRWFHQPAACTLCTTETHRRELIEWGLTDLVVWGRGVDTRRFQQATHASRQRPRLLYVGRLAIEKNIEAFLGLDLDADKIVVGDGPLRGELEKRYPDAQFLGYRRGQPLADEYAQADVFVFPSRTDTFGLVMLEANACGTPVAAYPVTGPIDVVQNGLNGALDDDLDKAVHRALELSREDCRLYAQENTWERVAHRLHKALVHIDWQSPLLTSLS